MYMIDFTPEQYAVFVGGVRYIKKVIKKKGKRKPTRNRKKKKGTRRRQKGGNKLLRTIINGLFLAALFSAYLIHTGTDMSLQTGIIAFSNASDLGVNADDVNNFMEGLAIMIFYSGYGWDLAGQSIPSTCEEAVWAPSVPGYGRIDSLSFDPIPGWSTNCPKIAHILGTVLSSVLAGMFMAWIGPCIIEELTESIMGPPPPTPAPQITSSVQQSNDDAAQDILNEAMSKIEEEEESSRRQQISMIDDRPRKLLTREQQAIMAERSEARRMACASQFANPPLPTDISRNVARGISISPDVKRALQNARQIPPGATPEDVRAMSQGLGPTPTSMNAQTTRGRRTRGLQTIQEEPSAPLTTTSQQLVPSSLQEESEGNTLITLPAGVMAELRQSGDLAQILKMVNKAANHISKQDQFQQKVAIMEGTIFQMEGQRLQLQDGLPQINCDTPLPSGSCPSIPRPLPKDNNDGPEIEELDDLTAGGAKRKQTRRRRKRNKKTKKKRPRNKKKSHKRR